MIYNFSLVKGPKFSKFWEIDHNTHFTHQISIRPMQLQRKNIIVLHFELLGSKALKFHKYNRRKVIQKDKVDNKVLKGVLTSNYTKF